MPMILERRKNPSAEKFPLLYMHIPKTAGTSIRQAIEKFYSGNEFVQVYGNQLDPACPDQNFIKRIKDQIPPPRFLFGHFTLVAHQLLNMTQPRYLTLLRDPIERVISFFGHVSREPRSRHYGAIHQGMTLKQFVLSHRAPELNNHAVRMLLGDPRWRTALWPPNPDHPAEPLDQLLDRSHFDHALDLIARHFLFVGSVGHLPELIRLLEAITEGRIHAAEDFPRCNTRPDASPPIDDETVEVIRQYNALDIELYDHFNREPLSRTEL